MTRRRLPIVLLLLAILPSVLSAAQAQSNSDKAKSAVIPVFTLSGPYTEVPAGDDLLLGMSGQEDFQRLLARLRKVRADENVKAVVLLGGPMGLGRAQLEEVRGVLSQIKAAGKEIHAHAESLSMAEYALLSGSTRLSVVPTGDVWLTGLYGESLHLRGLLDKIHVTPDFLTCGAYKSAAEMYTRNEPSKEADENLNWLMDGIYQGSVDLIAQGRNTSKETVQQWIDTGLYSAEKAAQLGIIDAVEFRHEFEAGLQAKYGEKVKFDRKYGKEKDLEIDFSSPMGILKFYAELLGGTKKPTSRKDAVAIVHVEGPILPGKPDPNTFPFSVGGIAYSTPIRKALDKAAEDDTIKAVVLRVNSPGGSAVASEIILQATRRVKDKKPLVVSMGDVAGSGGYYVACGSETIFAEPSTITASIGVVAGKLATEQMWDKIGIHFTPYERGKNAGMLYSGQPFTDTQREILQAWMDEIYQVFKGHVLAIRKDRLKKEIDELAGGRVYTGQQALEQGLVDKLGGLYDAIEHVAKQADLKDYEVRILPQPKNFIELLTESLDGEEEEDGLQLAIGAAARLPAARLSLADLAMPHLRGLEPDRLRAITTALTQLQTLQQERVMLTMPVIRVGQR